MIEQIQGKLINKMPTFAIVDVGGIGYGINISAYTGGLLPDENSDITLFTTLIVREDSLTLFGFIDKAEKDVFLMLLEVNGIGPKMAQRILSGVSPKDLLSMIASDNKTALSKIKGLGKKTCEQMILTLKDKSTTMLQNMGVPENGKNVNLMTYTGARLEAVLALKTLGVKDQAAEKAVTKAFENLGENADAAALIPEALKLL